MLPQHKTILAKFNTFYYNSCKLQNKPYLLQFHLLRGAANTKFVEKGMNMFCPTTKEALYDDLPYLIICLTIFALEKG